MSKPLKMIGLFCRISTLLQGSFAKETYDFKEPTNQRHPISENNYQRRIVRDNLIERNPLPRGGFLFTMFLDPEPCVRDFTTRCDGRISS